MINTYEVGNNCCIYENSVFYKKNQEIKFVDHSGVVHFFFYLELPFALEGTSQDFLIISTKENLLFVDIDKKEIAHSITFNPNSQNQLKYWNNESILLRSISDKNYCQLVKMDFNANILWSIEFTDPFLCSVCSDILCLNLFKTKRMAAVSYKTGVIVWTNDLSNFVETGNVYQPSSMLCYNGKQYIDLKSSNRNGILTLDLYSGIENWFYPGNIGFIKSDLINIYAAKYSNILCKIDTLCDEVSEWEVDKLIKKNGFQTISDTRCAAENGLIYFTQTLGDVNAKIGILDTHEKKLVSKHEFDRKHGGIGSIKVKKGRVFVHTQDQMLHVFEPIQTSL